MPLDHSGRINLTATLTTDVIVDLLGYYTATSTAVTAGRFVAVPASRELDTRQTGGKFVFNERREIDLTELLSTAGVSGVSGVVGNLTVVDADSLGWAGPDR